MSKTKSRLSDKAQAMLSASQKDRINYLHKRVFIPYAHAKEILTEMEDLLEHPKVYRMPNLLIIARSNNGKTELLREFLHRHPAEDRPMMDTINAPVIYIQAPPGPSETIFLNKILETLWAPIKPNESPDKTLARVIDNLRNTGLKVLLIDEVNALLAGSPTKQRYFLNMLKYIGNELQIPVVLAGTVEAQQALSTDKQLESRFPTRTLPRWQWGDEFRRLLASFEYTLPLKEPSNLTDIHTAKKLYGLSEGIIGDLATILRSAAETAIKSGTEQINEEILKSCPAVARKSQSMANEL